MDEVEELVFVSPVHFYVQLLHAGEWGIGHPVIKVAFDAIEVDSDGEFGFQGADCSD